MPFIFNWLVRQHTKQVSRASVHAQARARACDIFILRLRLFWRLHTHPEPGAFGRRAERKWSGRTRGPRVGGRWFGAASVRGGHCWGHALSSGEKKKRKKKTTGSQKPWRKTKGRRTGRRKRKPSSGSSLAKLLPSDCLNHRGLEQKVEDTPFAGFSISSWRRRMQFTARFLSFRLKIQWPYGMSFRAWEMFIYVSIYMWNGKWVSISKQITILISNLVIYHLFYTLVGVFFLVSSSFTMAHTEWVRRETARTDWTLLRWPCL